MPHRPSLVLLLLVGPTAAASHSNETPFATEVIEFTAGASGVPGYDDPTAALGSPTRTTGGTFLPEAVTPFQPAWLPDEIVSLGVGLDHARLRPRRPRRSLNPFGIDLLVFGNAFCTDPSFPAGVCGSLYSEGGRIEVSPDGIDWHIVPDVAVDGPFPTIGWIDAGPYDTVAGTLPTDFTRPVDPMHQSQLQRGPCRDRRRLRRAGGGAGIDLAWVGLDAIRFVRLSNDGTASTPELDAIADVAPAGPGNPDLDGDGVVGGSDLGLMLVACGSNDATADLDGDGVVGGPRSRPPPRRMELMCLAAARVPSRHESDSPSSRSSSSSDWSWSWRRWS